MRVHSSIRRQEISFLLTFSNHLTCLHVAFVHLSTTAREPTATKPSQDNSSGTTLNELGIDDDDEIEQEDMFVDAHPSFQFQGREWGGPRRGGRLPEPTRYGDWERKGRCSDF